MYKDYKLINVLKLYLFLYFCLCCYIIQQTKLQILQENYNHSLLITQDIVFLFLHISFLFT